MIAGLMLKVEDQALLDLVPFAALGDNLGQGCCAHRMGLKPISTIKI